MFTTVYKFCNDNHWYFIAFFILACLIFWAYGCESTVESLCEPGRRVNRAGLENEYRYLAGKVDVLKAELDKQDEIKQSLLDAANVISSGGSVNPSGILNLVASIGGISFGLSQRQKFVALQKKNPVSS